MDKREFFDALMSATKVETVREALEAFMRASKRSRLAAETIIEVRSK